MPDAAVRDPAQRVTKIQQIAWDRLIPSELNPRRYVDEDKVREMADSIAAKGILQNLVARPHPGVADAFEIAAGFRRFRGFGLLVESGVLQRSSTLPVAVLELTDLDLVHLATIENVQRQDLLPWEEADGFFTMVRLGDSTENIAAMTGLSQRTVEQRVALAMKLAPEVRKAWEQGRLNLAQVQPFTIVDAAHQAKALKALFSRWGIERTKHPLVAHVSEIRRLILNEQIPVGRNIFKAELYKGPIERDLFDDTGGSFFTDREQFQRLQLEAVEAKRQALVDAGWSWVEVIDVPRGGEFKRWLYGQSKEKGKAGAIIEIRGDLGVDVTVGLTKREEERTSSRTRSIAAKSPRPALSREHVIWAHHEKTRRLQHAVAADPHMALALATMALLWTDDDTIRIRTTPFGYGEDGSFSNPWLRDMLSNLLRPLRKLISEEPTDKAPNPQNFRLTDETGAAALKILLGMKAVELTQLHAHLVAARFGSWGWHGSRFGDEPVVLAAAKVLGVSCEGFKLTEDYLKLMSKDQLARLALQAKIPAADVEAVAAKPKPAIIAAILQHRGGAASFIPPELRFADEDAIEEALKPPKKKAAKKGRR